MFLVTGILPDNVFGQYVRRGMSEKTATQKCGIILSSPSFCLEISPMGIMCSFVKNERLDWGKM